MNDLSNDPSVLSVPRVVPVAASPRPVGEAVERLLAAVTPIGDVEDVPATAARGRVLARAIVSAVDVPGVDNAQMDGYAVVAADLASARDDAAVTLPVSQRIAAGQAPTPLVAGQAARIFTGAPMPIGADAVVMQEAVDADAASGSVRFFAPATPGHWIRRRGEDIARGDVVVEAGTRLGPQHLGLAASVGFAVLPVVRRPRVALFSTGDELAMPGDVAPEDLRPGTLFNSNRAALRGLIEALGCEVVDLGVVPDTLVATRDALVRASSADCIVTSGGVSVGEEDHVRPAVAAEGVVDFWKIAIKPGKPLAFGRVRDALFVGLPGNPVSSFVTFLVLVRPLLLRLQGVADVAPPAYRLRADFDWPRPDDRQEYLRVRSNADGGLDLFARQGSAVMTSTAWADGLVENPPGTVIARGDPVRFLPFAALIG